MAKRLPALDGLRAIAVLAVLLFHCKFTWAAGGAYGVDVFFALSGFLITTILLAEHERSGGVDFKAFYIRRSLRLIPALVCVVVACCIVESLLGPYDAGPSIFRRALWTLTYISNWMWAFLGGDALGALNAPWSLAIEEQFYLVWPPVLVGAFAAGIVNGRFALIVLLVAMSTAVWDWWLTRQGATSFRTYAGTDVRIGVILLGCAFAILAPSIEKHAPRRLLPAIGIIAFALLLWILSSGYLHTSVRLAYLHRLEVGALTLALVAVVLYGDPRFFLNRLLALPPLVYIGQISYGIYLWHGSANLYLARYAPASPMWLRIGAGLLLAVGSYHLVELYFLRQKNRWTQASVSDAAPAVSIG